MTAPKWVSAREAIVIHALQIAEFGGRAGIRDLNMLESALARPINKYLYAAPKKLSIPHLAAVYAMSLLRNHPFVDGNKRVGLVVSAVFLEKNGFSLNASQVNAYHTFMSLADGSLKEGKLVAWYEKNSQPAKRRPERASD